MAAFDADAREHAVGGHCIVGDLVEASAHFRELANSHMSTGVQSWGVSLLSLSETSQCSCRFRA